MKSKWLCSLSLLVLAASALCAAPVTVSAQDEDLETLAAAFGSRTSVLDVSLSPSGTKLAIIVPGGPDEEIIQILDLTKNDPPVGLFPFAEVNAELRQCDWANEEYIVCEAYTISSVEGLLLGANRLFSIAIDGSNFQMLSAETSPNALEFNQNGGDILALDVEGEENSVLMTRDFLRETSIGSRARSQGDEGLGVELVNVTDGSRSRVQRPDDTVRYYWADEHGRIRLRVRQERGSGGILRPDRHYSYRPTDSNRWESLSSTGTGDSNEEWFEPVAVETARNVAYGFAYNDAGFFELHAAALDGSGNMEVLLSREGTDVDQLIRIGRQRRVVGASYATERRQVEYFDEELARLAEQLHNALPGNPLINIIDASEDENILLIAASSDVDPGSIYMLDRNTLGLTETLAIRNELRGRQMAPMQPVTFPASDGTQIPGYLTKPLNAEGPLPTIVMPHGGPSARDEWGFDWMVQFFAARGYAVLQPNYRGSSGFGAEWFGENGFQAWEVAIGDVNDAGRWLVSEGIADPDKLVIAGWSYGGYAALQSQVLDPDLYKAVVAIAPVTDLEQLRGESRRFTNSRLVREFIGDGAHISEGSPARNAERFTAPVILFHGTTDQNVGVGQSRLMRDRLEEAGKTVEYHEFEDRDHQLDSSWVRGRMLYLTELFLSEALD